MVKQEKIVRPRGSAWGALAVMAIAAKEVPKRVNIGLVEEFSTVILCEMDDPGDARNYPVHERSFTDTVGYYHPGMIESGVEVNFGLLRERLGNWLRVRKLDNLPALRWCLANAANEHLAGGGMKGDIPEEIHSYLEFRTTKGVIRYPNELAINRREDMAWPYRMITNGWLAHELVELGLGEGRQPDRVVEKVWGVLNIYQMNSDLRFEKNPDELTWRLIMEKNKRTDSKWNKSKEVANVAKMAELSESMSWLGNVATAMLCLGRKPEWEH